MNYNRAYSFLDTLVSEILKDKDADVLYLARQMAARINELVSSLDSHIIIETDAKELNFVLGSINYLLQKCYPDTGFANFFYIIEQYKIDVAYDEAVVFVNKSLMTDLTDFEYSAFITEKLFLSKLCPNSIKTYNKIVTYINERLIEDSKSF